MIQSAKPAITAHFAGYGGQQSAKLSNLVDATTRVMTEQKIILGITGGIAAYKTPELIRRLRDRGAEVQVVLTRSAREFVTETTLQAVSGRPVRSNLWDSAAEAAMGHIELARWADLVLIAPATAEIMARLAAGSAPDLLTTLCLATEAPIVIAPAMNHVMWSNPAVQENRQKLADRGVRILGPATGDQACGETGPGRMLEPDEIVAAVTGAGRGSRCRAGTAGRQDGHDYRRADARSNRSGALYQQSKFGKDGFCACERGAASRCERDTD